VLFRNNATNYRPYDIAVDVYSRFLYWTDRTTNSVSIFYFIFWPLNTLIA